MRITEHTSSILSLQAKRYPLWIEAIGISTVPAIFLAAGLTVILEVGKLTTLKCDRVEPIQINCELILSGLLGKEVNHVRWLQGAEVEERRGSDGNTYRVLLVTQEGKIPLTNLHTARSLDKYQNAAKINNFINSPAENFIVLREDHRWLGYLIGSMLMLLGGGAFPLLMSEKPLLTSCVFDRDLGRVCLTYKNTLLRSKVRQEKLDSIANIQVDETTDSDGYKAYDTKLILESGSLISLGWSYKPVEVSEVAKVIKQFLNMR